MRTNKELKKEYDKDFPVDFCPVCGSYHTIGSGRNNPLLGNNVSWNIICNTCKWEFEIFILKKRRKPKRFRYDDIDCKECNEYLKDIGVLNQPNNL